MDRLIASSADFAPVERLDLVVHALAQAPPRVRALIAGGEPPGLLRLARAYGLEDRVSFGSAGDAHPSATDLVVYPSRANLRGAPLRPAAVPRHAVLRESSADDEDWRFADLVEATFRAEDPPAPTALEAPANQRVAIVTNIPAHSRIPLFEAVAARLEAAGSSLHVLFLAPSYARRSWMAPRELRFEHTFLRSVGMPLGRERHPFVPRDLGRALARSRATIVVSGGFSPAVSWRAAAFARRQETPFLLWSGETLRAGAAESRARRALARRSTAALAYGESAAEYLRRLDPGLPLVHVRNTTPTPEPADRRVAAHKPLRCLTVAELSSPRKGIDVLIEAFRMIDPGRASLTVVGDGPERRRLQARAAGVGERVRFVGAIPSDRVAERYREADCYLFPSRSDIFGLVLVEALAAGLPTITSAAPGAVEDLVADGRNALVVRGYEPRAWAEAIGRMSGDRQLRDRLAAGAAATVRRRWTMDHSSAAFVAGIRLAASAPPRR